MAKQDPKGKTPLTAVRLPEEMLARIEALQPAIAASPEGDAMPKNLNGDVSVSYVIRRALAIGLASLEEQYAPAGRRRK